MKAKVLLVGGNGFLGKHIAASLHKKSFDITVFSRSSKAADFPFPVQIINGSVLDFNLLSLAIKEMDYVYFMAGLVKHDLTFKKTMEDIHVGGTKILLKALKGSSVKRCIYISSSGVIAVSAKANSLVNENFSCPEDIISKWPYYETKMRAEKLALRLAAQQGNDLVVLNPSLLLGPGDDNFSSNSSILKILKAMLPASPSGGLNFIDVRDAARAAVKALKKARAGQRYLLGGHNLSFDDYFFKLAEISGMPSPKIRMPDSAATRLSKIVDPIAKSLGQESPLNPVEVSMSQHYWYFDNTKAVSELDLEIREKEETLGDAIYDLLSRGYGKRWFEPLKHRIQSGKSKIEISAFTNKKTDKDLIAITGANGFIGRFLVDSLISAKKKVRVFVMPGENYPPSWKAKLEVIEGDLTSLDDAVNLVKGAGTVIHLAAMVGDYGKEYDFQNVTVRGTYNVALAASKFSAHLLLISSVVIYGDQIGKRLLKEDLPFGKPMGVYSRSKIEQEKVCRLIDDFIGLRLTILRPTNVWGKGSKYWVDSIIEYIKAGVPSLVDKGHGNAGLLHVKNFVKAIELVCENKKVSIGKVYNVCDGSNVSWHQYFHELSKLAEIRSPASIPFALADFSSRLLEPTWNLLKLKGRPPITKEALNLISSDHMIDISRIQKELNFNPELKYEDALKELL